MKQLHPATCTKPSAVQQPSYSTMTSSQTSTDKTACTTTKQPPSKQAIATSTNPNFDQMDVKQIKAFISAQSVQVSTYHKPNIFRKRIQLLLWTFLLTLTLKVSPFVNVCYEASCFHLDKKFWPPSKWHHCPVTSPSSL